MEKEKGDRNPVSDSLGEGVAKKNLGGANLNQTSWQRDLNQSEPVYEPMESTRGAAKLQEKDKLYSPVILEGMVSSRSELVQSKLMLEEEPEKPTRGGATLQETDQFSASVSSAGDLVRFKPGVRGRKIQIESNHVRMDLGNLTRIYRYDIAIEPECESARMLKETIHMLRSVYFPDNYPCYDGERILYSSKRLPLEDDVLCGRVTLTLRKSQEFTIRVKLTQILDVAPLNNLLFNEEVLQCVETVFRQAYTDSFINRRGRFVSSSKNQITRHVEACPKVVRGWIPLLNVDVAPRNHTPSIAMMDLLIEMFSTNSKPLRPKNLKNFHLEGGQLVKMNEYLKDLKVDYKIPNVPSFRKNYRINGLANPANQERFLFGSVCLNVEQFFKTRFNLTLQYPNLPTLWVGNPSKKICIPMEFCILKRREVMRRAPTPRNLKKNLEDAMDLADCSNHPCVKEFGFSAKSNFEPLDARVLDPPTLQYSDGEVQPKGGTWWAKKFKKGASIKKWTILSLVVDVRNLDSVVHDFAETIQTYGNSSGMSFAEAIKPFVYIENHKSALVASLKRMKNYDLVVVIIPNCSDSYFLVKQEAEQTVGILTQCIKIRTLFNLNETTVRNILLKINCKMNGTNHTVCDLGLINDKPCMVMGADVSHDVINLPTVVAVTASYDSTATNYSTCVYLQAPHTEVIENLQNITLEKIRKIVEKTGEEPLRIYFFRQGLLEEDFSEVSRMEVAAIKKACDAFRSGYNPSLTVIVVQKGHRTKFFPSDDDSGENVPVGTCVDTVITHPTVQNFYLMSHRCVKGVGRPTRYWVLFDENGFSGDDVETLTYYLCHVYSRCNKSVRFPAPTYFAHLATERARGYLHNKQIDLENLDQNLVAIDGEFAERNPMFFS